MNVAQHIITALINHFFSECNTDISVQLHAQLSYHNIRWVDTLYIMSIRRLLSKFLVCVSYHMMKANQL